MREREIEREREKEDIALLWMSSWCLLTVSVLWLFLTVPWVGMQCVIVAFPDHTHILFKPNSSRDKCYTFLLVTVVAILHFNTAKQNIFKVHVVDIIAVQLEFTLV